MSNLRTNLIKLAHSHPELRKELLPVLKTAASDIELSELPLEQQELVSLIEGLGQGTKAAGAWDGIHGYVVSFVVPGHGARFTKNALLKFIQHPVFRWFEPDSAGSHGFSIGM